MESTIKIAFVSIINLNNIGGVKSYVDSLCDAYKQNGHKVKKISLGNLPFQKLIKNKAISDPKVEKIGQYKMAANIVTSIFKLKYILFKPDIVFFQDVIAFNKLYLYCKERNIKTVLVVHSYLADEAVANRFTTEKSKTFKYLQKQELEAYQNAPIIFTVDERIKKYITNKIKDKAAKDKIQDWINFVNTNKFRPGSKKKSRQKLNLPENKKIILCPRKLNMKNGVFYAVKAMQYLNKDFNLYICGDGPERESVEEEAKAHNIKNRVYLLGDIRPELMPDYYRAADYIVVPSIHIHGMEEATSIAGLEAEATKRPLIASNIGGLKQIVKHKKTGILVDEKSPKQIADWIIELEKNKKLKNSIAENAREFVVKNCSHKARAKEFLEAALREK